jgi:RNA polymerase-binding protein DksA
MNQAKRDKYRTALTALLSDLRDEMRHRVQELPEELHAPGDLWHEPTELFDSELETEHVQEKLYRQVAAALRRLDAGTFGRCLDCERPISEQRLDALPYTEFCLECERRHEGAAP